MRIIIGQRRRRGCSTASGVLLIECVVYAALFVVVTGVAYGAFYRCLTDARNLRRNAADIERVLQAGERWRADLRSARTRPSLEARPGEQILHVPQSTNEIAYVFAGDTVWRRMPGREPEAFLTRVRQSEMVADARSQVTAWRWEVELKSAQKVVRLRPMFTFAAVPGAAEDQAAAVTRGQTP
jgi:hypothetical protein